MKSDCIEVLRPATIFNLSRASSLTNDLGEQHKKSTESVRNDVSSLDLTVSNKLVVEF